MIVRKADVLSWDPCEEMAVRIKKLDDMPLRKALGIAKRWGALYWFVYHLIRDRPRELESYLASNTKASDIDCKLTGKHVIECYKARKCLDLIAKWLEENTQ